MDIRKRLLLLGGKKAITIYANLGYTEASLAAAALDSNVTTGGGTDDTAAIQAMLDYAETIYPTRLRLVIDGAALVSGLTVYSNTEIYFTNSTTAGLYLKAGSARALIRNGHRSKLTVTEQNVIIRNGYLNGNRANNAGSGSLPNVGSGNVDADNCMISGIQFSGVTNLTITGTHLHDVRAWAVQIALATNVHLDGITVTHGATTDENQDGVHICGPSSHIRAYNMTFSTYDDGFAVDSEGYNDPIIASGDVTDVIVDGIVSNGSVSAVRVLSGTNRLDNLTFRNLTGTVGNYIVVGDQWIYNTGNYGTILFENVNVDLVEPVQSWTPLAGMKFNGHYENLTIRNFTTSTPYDSRSLLLFMAAADIDSLTVDGFDIVDTTNITTKAIEVIGLVDAADIEMTWERTDATINPNPITLTGSGAITDLTWVNTPPRVTSLEVGAVDSKTIAIQFDKVVSATDYAAGWTFKVDGATVTTSGATRQADTTLVHYALSAAVEFGKTVTAQYSAASGQTKNSSDEAMVNFGPHAVTNNVSTIILDAFTDTTGTGLDAHTIAPTNVTETAWVEVSGEWTIQSNKAAQATHANANYRAVVDAEAADVHISVEITTPASTMFAAGIVFRYSDASNYLTAFIYNNGSDEKKLVIRKIEGGSETGVDYGAHIFNTGTTYKLHVITSGNSITASCDGTTVSTSSTFNAAATKHGIYEYRDSGTLFKASVFDNFTIG